MDQYIKKLGSHYNSCVKYDGLEATVHVGEKRVLIVCNGDIFEVEIDKNACEFISEVMSGDYCNETIIFKDESRNQIKYTIKAKDDDGVPSITIFANKIYV